jgi:hypothetical protein
MLEKRSQNPARTFWWVAIVALLLSILPNLGLMADPSAAPMPGGTAQANGVLIVFHFVAGLVFVPLFLAALKQS